MPHPLLIFSQSDYLIQIVAINSHFQWQTVQIQIRKPTDLDPHCLQMQGLSGFSRTRVNITKVLLMSTNTICFCDLWRNKILDFLAEKKKKTLSGAMIVKTKCLIIESGWDALTNLYMHFQGRCLSRSESLYNIGNSFPGPGCSKRRQLNELVKGHFVNCFSGFNLQYSDIFCWKKCE